VALVLAYIVTIVVTFCFSRAPALLASAMPRSGGDYVFVSRIVNPALGFNSSWNMFIYSSIVGLPNLGSFLIYAGIARMLYVLGAMLPNPALFSIGGSLVLPWLFIIVMGKILARSSSMVRPRHTDDLRVIGLVTSVGSF
jgi:amino acid transporter